MTLFPLKSSKNINLNMQRLVDVNKKRKQKNLKRPLMYFQTKKLISLLSKDKLSKFSFFLFVI